MGADFAADLMAIRALARDFLGESGNVGQLVTELQALDRAQTGDGGLDDLIERLLEDVRAAAGGAGMTFEADSRALTANASTYESVDSESASLARSTMSRLATDHG
jgi:hypothetical protein